MTLPVADRQTDRQAELDAGFRWQMPANRLCHALRCAGVWRGDDGSIANLLAGRAACPALHMQRGVVEAEDRADLRWRAASLR